MLTIRQVWAFNSNDSVIPALRCLTTDGAGGTFWAIPSSLGGIPAFNTVIANNMVIPATSPSNALVISTFGGLVMSANSTTNQINLAANCFNRFEVSSGNTLVAYSNNVLTPTVRFVARGSLDISADPLTNTLYFQTQPTSISTSIFGFNHVNVISNASTMSYDALYNSNAAELTATSISSALQFIGLGDILLSTNTTSNAIFIGISSFTAASFNALSNLAYGAFASTMSTVSTLFVDTTEFSTTISNVSTSISLDSQVKYQFITNNYTTNALFQYVSTVTASNISTLFTQTRGLNGGLVSSVNTFSSLTTTQISPLTGVITPGADGSFLVSTHSFRLDSLLTPITLGKNTVIDYSPSLLLGSNQVVTGATLNVSTFLLAIDNGITAIVPGSFYTRPVYNSIDQNNILYTDRLQIELSKSIVLASLTSTYQFCHNITHYYPPASTDIQDLINPTNSLSVRITGTNFAGVY